jgi:flagellar basal-body rod modification protein FlgD
MAVTNTTASTIMSRVAQQTQAPVATQSPATTGTTAAQSGTQLNANFDMFLQLLTAQLRNQSPLDPMKPDQFAQQITQYSAVEQQIRTNSLMERLITSSTSSTATASLGFLGNDVVARGRTADLRGGQASWTLNAPSAATGTITVRDAAGNVVRTENRALARGANAYVWDGRDQNGQARADGLYTIAIEARDAGGASVTVDTSARGRVTAVDFSGAEPMLTIGGARVKLSDVTSVALAR